MPLMPGDPCPRTEAHEANALIIIPIVVNATGDHGCSNRFCRAAKVLAES